MKLHLPSLLRTAVLVGMACSATTYADTFIAEGVNVDELTASTRFYDGGKGRDWSYFSTAAANIYNANDKDLSIFGDLAPSIGETSSYNLNFSNLTDDSGHCWAYTSSNMLQYWQSYYGVFSKKAGDTTKSAPVHGLNYDQQYMTQLGGTQSLKLNKLFYDNFTGSVGGSTNKAFGWYLYGENDWLGQTVAGSAPGYFRQYFDGYNDTHNTVNAQNLSSLSAMSDSIKQAFGYTQQNGEWVQTTKGQIMHLELSKSGGSHAITCYGFETDAEGNIKALYVVNSDDAQYQLVKVYVKFEERGDMDYALSLHYDEECSGYNTYNAWSVTGWSNVNTPQVLKDMLAEYESGKQTWMGNLSTWTNDPATAAAPNVLPTDETGWMVYAGTGTEHAGYYNSYYTAGNGVLFNDDAASGTVNVGDNISVATMEVNNSNLAYSFDGGESRKTITTGEFSKTGSGAVELKNITLMADTVTISNGSTTLDTLADGAAVRLSGGTLTVTNSGSWTNIDSLEISDKGHLNIGASLKVAGNISTCEATGTLPEGMKGGITTKWCLEVGTEGDANTGHVNLKGDIKAGAYVKILGNATIDGSITTDKEDITIGGTANISGNLSTAQGGNIYLNKGGSVGGTLSAATITVKDSASLGTIGTVSGENETGTVALVLTGGTTKVTSTEWTNLKSLDMSDQARLNVGASLNVAENITSSAASTATLAEGTQAGINTTYCLKVGTEGKEGTGNVTVKGDVTAGAYISILGNADVTGNLSTSKDYISIGGTTKVGGNLGVTGDLNLGGDSTVGGNLSVTGKLDATGNLNLGGNGTVGGTLTAKSLELAAGKTLAATGNLTVNGALTGGEGSTRASVTSEGSMNLGGSVQNINLRAQSVTMAAADKSELTLDSVNIELTGGTLSLTNVVVQGDCSFTTTSAAPLTMTVDGVTFVLDASNSSVRGYEMQIMTMAVATENSNPIYIDSTMLEGLEIEGNMTLDLSAWAEKIQSGEYDSLVMTFTEDTDFSGAEEISMTLGDGKVSTLTKDADNPNSFTLALPKPEQAIPEPATATLNLLALAGLLARRRRK